MSQKSTIEWTDGTWNPVRGCTKVSPGCAHCYAERFAERFRGVPGSPFEQGFDLRIVPHLLAEPFRWSKSQRVFVNSMSDLFHEGVSADYISKVISVMRLASWHTYQVLTKRAERLADLLTGELAEGTNLSHVWWGVSVEDRRFGLPRIEELRRVPTITRFLSIEPLLEDLGTLNLEGIHWVIVGGESGTRPRPMKIDWVRSIRDQCQAAGVPFFFKQWGGTRKKQAGRELDGQTHDEMPRSQVSQVPDRSTRYELIARMSTSYPSTQE